MFGVSALPHAEAKFAGLDSDVAAYRQGVAQIGMAALIERAIQTDPRRKAAVTVTKKSQARMLSAWLRTKVDQR